MEVEEEEEEVGGNECMVGRRELLPLRECRFGKGAIVCVEK